MRPVTWRTLLHCPNFMLLVSQLLTRDHTLLFWPGFLCIVKNKLITLCRGLLDIGSVLILIQETSNVLGIHQAKTHQGEVIHGILTDVVLFVCLENSVGVSVSYALYQSLGRKGCCTQPACWAIKFHSTWNTLVDPLSSIQQLINAVEEI